ncbi:unnamed protein product [Durusdinium trenchii]|uniref:Uncharacterized protein n=1 Tax=Durusdinium trenchii TaxID=1381693 RepID=A0ABP0LUH7_9DINO
MKSNEIDTYWTTPWCRIWSDSLCSKHFGAPYAGDQKCPSAGAPEDLPLELRRSILVTYLDEDGGSRHRWAAITDWTDAHSVPLFDGTHIAFVHIKGFITDLQEMMIVRDESGVLVKELSAVAPKMVPEEQVEVTNMSNTSSTVAKDVISEEDRALLDAAESEAS